jgi:hypothetical protein
MWMRPAKRSEANALRYELEAFDKALVADVPATWRFKEYRRRTIITLAGKVTYLRRVYIEPSGICHALLDEILGIRTRFRLAPDAFLWIAKMASDISYRKTARAFYERTGAKISHWLVMAVVHEEGTLILEDAYCAHLTIPIKCPMSCRYRQSASMWSLTASTYLCKRAPMSPDSYAGNTSKQGTSKALNLK